MTPLGNTALSATAVAITAGLTFSVSPAAAANTANAAPAATQSADSPVTAQVNNVYVKIRHSGKCLTVHGNTTANGAQIDQYTCVGQANQRWNIIKNGTASWIFQSVRSQKCMSVKGGNDARGVRLIQWNCNGRGDQNFMIQAKSGKYRQISSHIGLNYCLDIQGGSTANNARLITWTCNSRKNQQFTW